MQLDSHLPFCQPSGVTSRLFEKIEASRISRLIISVIIASSLIRLAVVFRTCRDARLRPCAYFCPPPYSCVYPGPPWFCLHWLVELVGLSERFLAHLTRQRQAEPESAPVPVGAHGPHGAERTQVLSARPAPSQCPRAPWAVGVSSCARSAVSQ